MAFSLRTVRARWLAAATAALVLGAGGTIAFGGDELMEELGLKREPGAGLPMQARERMEMMAGEDPAEAGEEAFEASTIAAQWAEARTAPGVVAPGAYGAAFSQLQGLPATKGGWQEVTRVKYDSDDPRYRDYASNSSGGSGLVTGRITGLAADGKGHVYAAGADGGVWRSSTGGGGWTPIADGLPSLSSANLTLAADGSLWYATGEGNTGATSYVGSGVYRLADPVKGVFTPADRVGGTELESTTIRGMRFAGGKVWAATSAGVWTHDTSTASGAWHQEFAPNPDYLAGGSRASDPNAPYKNIANDVAIDPRDPKHVIAAIGWRSGDSYNGFYETVDYTQGPSSWRKINPDGAMPADDIGYVTFAFSADGSSLYAINQSPRLLNKPTGTVNSYLDGIYVSRNGSPAGPWNKIADSQKLGNSGSALKQAESGKGYGPGVQAWYNQFLIVDPSDANHVYAGLEEVYETTDGGSTWMTVGPYWNFGFACWNISDSANTCPKTTHPDQHSVAIGSYQGKSYVYVGNDGGVYRRPLRGVVNGHGNATDWQSMNDSTMDALQYYAVAVGKDGTGVAVSGGLQDNGVSVLRPGDTVMGSNFGGDGGDSMADPDNGCRQVQEYTNLAMRVTLNCNVNKGALDEASASSKDIQPYNAAPGDEPARFTAPFGRDLTDTGRWIAGGQHVWINTLGFGITEGKQWKNVFDLGAGHTATAVAMSQGTGYVGWCGPCNNAGFARGIATGRFDDPASWHQLTLPSDGSVLPNRYVSGFAADPANPQHVFVAVNGFSRRFTEGPGAGVGHVYESSDGGATWKDVSADVPDVPADALTLLPQGGLVLATDLGALYRAPGSATWARLGANLPVTAVTDVEWSAADQKVYAATHGRGIWSFALSQL
ncbi:glycosyl hydrolase [Microbispora catharanthi]|uniref:Glycosyl hydrolase n=1 Tax=Microbispora catharanthi TaxID=1712871 RepID=A0A5N6BRJ5_9ACTN|nr:glycosyl hydrolase [Microbispora catharanthi]KAB8183058.1 glycosyl hydrolase [Microbispora catharanthi]